jgi:nucleoside-diphosphate-sugar epimerase
MKVHLLGGSGFLGGRVVERLLSRGDTVTSTARSDAAAEKIRARGADPINGDLLVDEDIDRTIAASGADTLITSVSLGFGFGPRIVAAAEAAGIRRAIFVSTTSIYTSLDSWAKPIRQRAEEAITASSLDWTIVRPTMIYGAPEDGNMVRLLRLVRRTPVVPLPGGGKGLQQPVHVDDVAAAIVGALDAPASIWRSYDLAGPDALTFRQVVVDAGGAVGRKVFTVGVPLAPVIAVARLAERFGRAPLRSEQLERLEEDKAFDISAARADLGFAPRSLADGLRAEAQMLFSRQQ